LSDTISVESLTTLPVGISLSEFFGYTGAYTSVTTLDPGRGYWVKADEDGRIVLRESTSIQLKMGK
jgi:hypothetical protein